MHRYKVWWKESPSPGNFGDILTPIILKHFKIPFEYSKDYNLISTGSIAKKAKAGTLVLGSGMLSDIEYLDINARWLLVRGPLTRDRILELGGSCPKMYGDPGLLLPLIVKESKKEYDVAIVPHYTEYSTVKKLYPTIPVINLLNKDPLTVAKQITKYRSIISSSLHGIVCAHAYNIPVAWVSFGNKIKGNNFKFRDYYASVNLEANLSTMKDLKFTTADINFGSIANIFRSI